MHSFIHSFVHIISQFAAHSPTTNEFRAVPLRCTALHCARHSQGNGGEYRKSFKFLPKGFGQMVESPQVCVTDTCVAS